MEWEEKSDTEGGWIVGNGIGMRGLCGICVGLVGCCRRLRLVVGGKGRFCIGTAFWNCGSFGS